MRPVLQILGVLLALAGCTFWLQAGGNKGWTKTSVAVEKVDEITGIPYREYEKRFVPGVEVPVASVAIGGLARRRRLVERAATLGKYRHPEKPVHPAGALISLLRQCEWGQHRFLDFVTASAWLRSARWWIPCIP